MLSLLSLLLWTTVANAQESIVEFELPPESVVESVKNIDYTLTSQEDDLYASLFDEEPAVETTDAQPSAEQTQATTTFTSAELTGALGVIGVLLLVAMWLKRKIKPVTGKDSPAPELKIRSRISLGGNNALAVVEVTGTNGSLRRLLVGVGAGAPTMVADLGGATPATETERTHPVHSFDEALKRQEAADPRRNAAQSLIAEVLSEREEPERPLSTRSRWA